MYLLDADICIFLMRGDKGVTEDARKHDRLSIHVSTVTLFELRVGLEKSTAKHVESKLRRLDALVRMFGRVGFDEGEAIEAARVRADLEARGKKIGAYDTMLAGVALANGWTLVTNNVGEFSRVKGLKVENWKV